MYSTPVIVYTKIDYKDLKDVLLAVNKGIYFSDKGRWSVRYNLDPMWTLFYSDGQMISNIAECYGRGVIDIHGVDKKDAIKIAGIMQKIFTYNWCYVYEGQQI